MGSGTTVVLLAAGAGTRMGSPRPKVLHPLCGRPLLAWVLDQALALDPERLVLVVGEGREGTEVEAAARATAGGRELVAVVQEPRLGTGHALQVAAPTLAGPGGVPGRVVVLYGDMPLLCPASLEALVEAQAGAGSGGSALLSARVDQPTGYGRIVRGPDGSLEQIVEERDASEQQRAIAEINLGVYCFDGAALLADLPELRSDNAQGELYITDLAAMAVGAGRSVAVVEIADPEESLGVNTLEQLAQARWSMQMRILEQHMSRGVLIEDPATTFIDHGVEIGAGTHVLPCTVIRSGVRIGAGCEVGPFSHLRVETVLADGAEVGNFTECKKTVLGPGTKAKHLSYLGDAEVGAHTNIGAGTVFANYDGKSKHKTKVGDRVFVGSGTIVVAPNEIPDGAVTGAGALVTRTAKMQPGDVFVGVPARKFVKKPAPPED